MRFHHTRATRRSIGMPALIVMIGMLGLLAGPGLRAVRAQPTEFSAMVQIAQPSGNPMEMTYWVTEGQFRMDMPEMSIIWSSGDQPRMLMIQHAEKRYIEWGARQLDMMQQMMGRVPGGGGSGSGSDDPMSGSLSFEATGNSETIGAWNAFEVQVRNEDGDQGQLWLTEDTDVGLFEVFASVVDMAAAMRLPMGMGGQSSNPQEMLQGYAALARAQGLPEGRAVRIVSTESGGSTVTLTAVQPGSPPAGTFDPPVDYQKMEMPRIPGLR